MDDADRVTLEEQRRASLAAYGLTDAEVLVGDEDLEVAAAVARAMTGAEAGAVHVIEAERQVRVAADGAPEGAVPRSVSMCTVAMWHPDDDGVYLAEDASQDPLLADNPFVTGEVGSEAGAVRFYAAAPLVGREGLPLGTVCAWSSRPGTLDGDQREALARLSEFVTRVLDLRRRARELEHDALHDPLTGLGNRRLLRDRLQHALALSGRAPAAHGRPALVLLDLDGFKAVNDEHGHAAGDEVLRVVGRRLAGAVREADTVVRYGGDEFVVVVEDRHDDDLDGLVARLVAAVEEPVALPGGGAVRVGATPGVALARPGTTPDGLTAEADAAMYAVRTA